MKVRIADAALRDLADIERHIGQDSPRAAQRQTDALFDACRALAEHPRRYAELGLLGLRRRPSGAYLIFYRITETVEVVRILHAARDWTHLLGPETD